MLPGAVLLLLIASLAVLVTDLIQRCIGRTINPLRSKAGFINFAIETARTPLLFFGTGREVALAL